MPDASDGTMLADRAVIRVAGPDARDFLQGLVTSDLTLLTPDRPLWTGLLTPQGKVLFDFILWAGEDDDVLIDAEAAQTDALSHRLLLYRLRRAITIERTPLAVHWSRRGDVGVAAPRLASLGRRWLGPAADPANGWLAHRLSFGVTEGFAELGDGDTLWLECNARELGGVSFSKGCYVGQENTARMHHRSTVNRRLVVAPDAGADNVRARYPDLSLLVDRRRVDDLGDAVVPAWLAAALAVGRRPTAG